MLKTAIVTTVDTCTRYAVQVIGIAVLLAVVAGVFAAKHFAIDADVNKLISDNLPWRQRSAAFDKSFPPKEQTNGWDAFGRVIRCEPTSLGYRVAVEFDRMPAA